MIDRYLLRYLLAVVDRGSFTRAAAHCGVSQPTLSVGIAKLEAEVGTALLLRTNRRIELTGAGVRWVERARRIEREFTLGEQEATATERAATLRLGILSSLPARWIEQALGAAHRTAGSHRIEVVEGPEKTLLAALDRGRLDVLLGIVRPHRARFCEPVFTEGYALVLPPGHPLAGRAAIEAHEVAEGPMIVRRHCEALTETSRHFTALGVRPFMSARVDADAQALALVRAGHGLTVMPEGFRGEHVAMARLAGFDLRRTIGLVHDRIPAERVRSDALEAIRATIELCHEEQRPPAPPSGQ